MSSSLYWLAPIFAPVIVLVSAISLSWVETLKGFIDNAAKSGGNLPTPVKRILYNIDAILDRTLGGTGQSKMSYNLNHVMLMAILISVIGVGLSLDGYFSARLALDAKALKKAERRAARDSEKEKSG